MQNSRYKVYTLQNFRQLPQIKRISEEQRFEIEVAGQILPFKTNNYVVEELINWDKVPDDPLFLLTFPQKEMLRSSHFEQMTNLINNSPKSQKIREMVHKIRLELHPHPSGQMEHNIPFLEGVKLKGMQHKYKETVLFFPTQGQTCHAYCSFCFRWPQFTGINGFKFAMQEKELLTEYIRRHQEISDVLFTGGDPLVMKAKTLASYLNPLLKADLPHLKTIRIGTKALAFWPYRFLSDPDTEELLALFKKVIEAGKHLAIMTHFNHPRELKTESVKRAISRLREIGAEIRTQSPLLDYINAEPEIWVEMWKEQVRLGCIPYYMFVARDTGAQHYFGVPLIRAWDIFQKAFQRVSGLSRTIAGPTMSATPGKIRLLGVNEVKGEKVFVLQFVQGRKPDWVMRPFFAQYDEKAIWFDELRPAFGKKKFFFEEGE